MSADEVVAPPSPEVGQYQFLLLLNKEYILALNQRRQHHAPGSAAARFDVGLMRSAVLFNQKLDAEHALYHDKNIHVAELCGSLVGVKSWDSKRLAQHILAQLAASPSHEVIQMDDEKVFVGMSSSKERFVVRLSNTPDLHSRREHR